MMVTRTWGDCNEGINTHVSMRMISTEAEGQTKRNSNDAKCSNWVWKGPNTVRLSSPWGSTPLWWCCSPGWRARLAGSSASCRSRSPFCPRTETLPAGWPPAAWPPSSSLWHRRSGFGKWLPLEPPCGTSSSQSLQRSGSTLLESSRGQTRGQLMFRYISINSNHLFSQCSQCSDLQSVIFP